MASSLPPVSIREDPETGLRIVTEYRYNDDGKKVKVTRKIKLTLNKVKAQHSIAERKRWQKFGEAARKKRFDGEDDNDESSLPALGEEIKLHLRFASEQQDDSAPLASISEQVKKLQSSKISCRICQGDHWTTKCPYKDTFKPGQVPSASGAPAPATTPSVSSSSAASPAPMDSSAAAAAKSGKYVPPKPGKYVPPSQRSSAPGGPSSDRPGTAGSTSFNARGSEEETTTIRVSNLSEDASEHDLQRLFGKFGPIQRVFLARHRDSGMSRGYGFITFRSKGDAERAKNTMHGFGFDSLILQVEWARN